MDPGFIVLELRVLLAYIRSEKLQIFVGTNGSLKIFFSMESQMESRPSGIPGKVVSNPGLSSSD